MVGCKQMAKWLTQDVSDELVALVGEFALREVLGVASDPASGLHPLRLLRVVIIRGDYRVPVHLLHRHLIDQK